MVLGILALSLHPPLFDKGIHQHMSHNLYLERTPDPEVTLHNMTVRNVGTSIYGRLWLCLRADSTPSRLGRRKKGKQRNLSDIRLWPRGKFWRRTWPLLHMLQRRGGHHVANSDEPGVFYA